MKALLQMSATAASLWAAGAVFAAGGDAVLPVLKHVVYAGDLITADMIDRKPAGQMQGAGAFVTDSEALIGKTARRTLLPGQPIPKQAIRDPYLVLQGKNVTVMFQEGTIIITGIALALESGSAGDLISARNPDSGIVIRGVVQSDGVLRAR
jgi:flagellar basal body P-ring formation protein FlgA